jgi:hypothetical protein
MLRDMDAGFRKYLIQFQSWIKTHCAPVFFRNETDERRNGSMTFVNTGTEILGITAGHVADRILECCDGKPGHGCQVGGAELDTGRLIARHPRLDLATFQLSEQFLAIAGSYATSFSSWPPSEPREGEKALIGGYPGVYRQENTVDNEIEVKFAHFGVSVSSVSDHRFYMVLNIASAEALTFERIPEQIDLGGISGGCVFRVVEEGFIAHVELMGILVGGSASFETTFAHTLTCMNEDGTFSANSL